MNVLKKNPLNFRKTAIFSMAGLTFLAISSMSNPVAAQSKGKTANCSDGTFVRCIGDDCDGADSSEIIRGWCECYDEEGEVITSGMCANAPMK